MLIMHDKFDSGTTTIQQVVLLQLAYLMLCVFCVGLAAEDKILGPIVRTSEGGPGPTGSDHGSNNPEGGLQELGLNGPQHQNTSSGGHTAELPPADDVGPTVDGYGLDNGEEGLSELDHDGRRRHTSNPGGHITTVPPATVDDGQMHHDSRRRVVVSEDPDRLGRQESGLLSTHSLDNNAAVSLAVGPPADVPVPLAITSPASRLPIDGMEPPKQLFPAA
jgi:hypothetical protein